MDPWGWIAVYLVGFVVFQALLFRYFGSGRALGDSATGPIETPASGGVDVDSSVAPGEESGGSVVCPHCGVRNADDGMYSRCRFCVGELR